MNKTNCSWFWKSLPFIGLERADSCSLVSSSSLKQPTASPNFLEVSDGALVVLIENFTSFRAIWAFNDFEAVPVWLNSTCESAVFSVDINKKLSMHLLIVDGCYFEKTIDNLSTSTIHCEQSSWPYGPYPIYYLHLAPLSLNHLHRIKWFCLCIWVCYV